MYLSRINPKKRRKGDAWINETLSAIIIRYKHLPRSRNTYLINLIFSKKQTKELYLQNHFYIALYYSILSATWGYIEGSSLHSPSFTLYNPIVYFASQSKRHSFMYVLLSLPQTGSAIVWHGHAPIPEFMSAWAGVVWRTRTASSTDTASKWTRIFMGSIKL